MAATKNAQAVKNDTKEFITTAVAEILAKHKLSSLTVSQVCERAGVSRMAFYRNFDTLEQVVYEYYQPQIAAVFDVVRRSSQYSAKYAGQLNFFNTFGDVLLLANEHEFEPIIRRIVIEEIERFYAADADEYRIAFMAAGVYAVWRKWLVDGRKKPLEEIMSFFERLADMKNIDE
jgi:AcrR family transcriptional regulator